jgi:hypothetical protein
MSKHTNITIRDLLEADKRLTALERNYSSRPSLRSLVALMRLNYSLGIYKHKNDEFYAQWADRISNHYTAYLKMLKAEVYASFRGGRIPSPLPSFNITGGGPKIVKVGSFKHGGKTYYATVRADKDSFALTLYDGPLPDDSKYTRSTYYIALQTANTELVMAHIALLDSTQASGTARAVINTNFRTYGNGEIPVGSVDEIISILINDLKKLRKP